MDKKFTLKIFPLFEEDLNEIVDYISINLKNPIAANRLVDEIEAAILDRLTSPLAFEPYNSQNSHPYPYYRINIRNF